MSNDIKKLLALEQLGHFKDLLATVSLTNNYIDLDGKPFWIGSEQDYQEQKGDIPNNTWIIVEEDLIINGVKIVSWAKGSDVDVAAMIAGHDAGKINIYDYWNLKDTREVNVNALPGEWDNGHGESATARKINLALIDTEYGNNNIHFVIAQTSNTYSGYINYTDTNVGGWRDCARRYWCNNILYNGLESGIKNLLKPFSVLTPESANNMVTTTDYLSLISFTEHYGKLANHGAMTYDIEQESLSQFKIFSNGLADATKMFSGAKYRSPVPNSSSNFGSSYSWKSGRETGVAASDTGSGYFVVFGCI